MAVNKYLDLTGLSYFWDKLKNSFAKKPVVIPLTWTANSTTLTVTNAAFTVNSLITMGVQSTTTAAQFDMVALAKIICTNQATGTITLTAIGTKPTAALPIELTVIG